MNMYWTDRPMQQRQRRPTLALVAWPKATGPSRRHGASPAARAPRSANARPPAHHHHHHHQPPQLRLRGDRRAGERTMRKKRALARMRDTPLNSRGAAAAIARGGRGGGGSAAAPRSAAA
eukprot:scaffold4437_cov391-Prasinococcus_capsulatus_cf.AAC.18